MSNEIVKFYADENFPRRTVEELRNLGHDVLTTYEDGKANRAIPDEEVLARAIEIERAVLSLNRLDFKRLHQANSNHFGIVICTEDTDRPGQARRISENVSKFEGLKGLLIRIYRQN